MNSITLSLEKLVQGLLSHMESIGYTESTRERYAAYYRVFLKYAAKNGISDFSEEIGRRFLCEHHGLDTNGYGKHSIADNYLLRHMRILHEYQQFGRTVTKKRKTKPDHEIGRFADIMEDYLCHLRDCGVRESTLRGKRHILLHLFGFLIKSRLTDMRSVGSQDILGFLHSRTHFSVSTKENYQYQLRALIKYLSENSLCRPELADLFDVISVHSKNAYPSYFPPGDIAKILDAVDVSTPIGKRDYAMLLLAAELGLRKSDIFSLKTAAIDFRRRIIYLTQVKTEGVVSLPMSEELVVALLDYYKNARPSGDCKEFFLSAQAPRGNIVNGHFLYGILQKHIKAAGVEVPMGQKHGPHSLRSSLASNMLGCGTSAKVISDVLGHRLPGTAVYYVKIDIDGLRKVALEVPML